MMQNRLNSTSTPEKINKCPNLSFLSPRLESKRPHLNP